MTLSFIIALASLALIVSFLFRLADHPQIAHLRLNLQNKVKIFFANVSDSVSPPRRKPLTTIELEENLKLRMPDPFARFQTADWNWFWHVLYDRFPVESDGWPRQQRQLSQLEVQDMLVEYYYQPFGRFNRQQWGIFWQTLLKGRAF